MDDVTVKRIEELESYEGKGQFCYAGKSGVIFRPSLSARDGCGSSFG